MKPKARKVLNIVFIGIAATIALLLAAAVVVVIAISQGQFG